MTTTHMTTTHVTTTHVAGVAAIHVMTAAAVMITTRVVFPAFVTPARVGALAADASVNTGLVTTPRAMHDQATAPVQPEPVGMREMADAPWDAVR